MEMAADTYTDDPADWAAALKKYFGSKWRVAQPQAWATMMDFLHAREGRQVALDDCDIRNAFGRIDRRSLYDQEGICVDLWRLAFEARPTAFAAMSSRTLASTTAMMRMQLAARAMGKGTSSPAPGEVRVIIPLSSLMQFFDAFLACRLDASMVHLVDQPRGVFIGGVPRTQGLDIALGLQTVMEKALDKRSEGGIAQADIAQYYDSLPVIKVARWLEAQGACHAFVAALVRHQMLPQLHLRIGPSSVLLARRTSGSLTGSRVAGALARVPVADACAQRHTTWQKWGFPCTNGPCLTCDNSTVFWSAAEAASVHLK